MAKRKLKVIVIGAGCRGRGYTDIMAEMPDKFKVVGVAEPIDDVRQYIIDKHGVAKKNAFVTWEHVFEQPKFADIVIISTMDKMHYGPAMKAIELGYDILLEKPVSPDPVECAEILKAAKEKGTKIMVCHVLRFTSFFRSLKHYIDSGKLGRVMSIEHTEAVGHIHQSHSFVRGNWGNEEESSFMLLQKCCHDIDILQWLLGKDCKKIQSFGSLTYFTPDNAPEGSPEYCIDGCPEADKCYYNAVKLYYENNKAGGFKGMMNRIMTKMSFPTEEAVLDALKTTQYGKCVFKCNNDVVDHQTLNMEFEDGTTIAFSMNCFNKGGRYTRIFGTKGELIANAGEKEADFYSFETQEHEKLPTNDQAVDQSIHGGHGGGDVGILNVLYDYVLGKIPAQQVSEIGISCKNHLLVFAAEESRKTGKVINVDEYNEKLLGKDFKF